MIPGRRDYNLIGTKNDPIPDNEPVFILRAQDTLAESVVRIYAVLVETQLHDLPMATSVRELADLFHVWPTRKNPDLPRQKTTHHPSIPNRTTPRPISSRS